MKEMTIRDAVNLALTREMEQDPAVFIMGEDIGIYGGAFGVTKGMLDQFGPQRILETPISEASLMGIATGCALSGMKPILEIMFMDFTTLITDQILNHAVKLKYMFGGKEEIKIPVVVRAPFGGGRAYGASHSQSLEGLFMHMPGIKIVAPSTPQDAYTLLRKSIQDPNPVLFLEHKLLYSKQGAVDENNMETEIGKAKLTRTGNDVSIFAYGRMHDFALEAASKLSGEGYEAEVTDLITISPMDKESIRRSAAKTGRVVIVEEGTVTGGVGAEISAVVMENSFFSLEAPPVRVASPDIPIPYSPTLENAALPDVGRIVRAAMETLKY
ncbi:MAG: alpha-ketoacid dehydrogenase subunit beta [Firmicutes bacterium]|nr:alpha-ketoacid dehydrogenase subunit beta [Bacillota bacterium]